jgi:catecholate siderophore receptor
MFFSNFFRRNFLIGQIIFSFFCAEIFAKTSPSPEFLKNNSANNILPKITITATNENQDGYKAENVTSSTRTNKILRDIPQAINAVSQQQIRDQNIVNMEQATLYIPSVNIQQGEGNRDQISIRGNSSTADFFIDGARDDMQYFRDFYNIEKVEFLNGPNALAFGRGGAGGLVNRVSKFADGVKKRQIILSGGSFENRRFQTDLSEKINENLSLRFNGFYEKSQSFRDYGNLERFGFNPTGTIVLGKNTDVRFGYEHFYDNRFNDRGVPSKNGEPLKTSASKFFGNPNENDSENKLDSVFATINHEFQNQFQLKNYTRFTKYSKFYKNVYASGEVGSNNQFNLSAYNNSQERKNFTNQTDLTKKFEAFSLKHLALFGTEITHQDSSSSRFSGYFNNKNATLPISIFDDINLTPITYSRA